MISFNQKTKTNNAFTLAEVLITLSIIGVVAAMTIPGILRFFEEKTAIEQFKKSYSTLSNAYYKAMKDEGGKLSTNSRAKDFYEAMKENLLIAEDCPMTNGCFPNLSYKDLHGDDNITYYSGTNSGYKLRLQDGTSVNIGEWASAPDYSITISFDINGDKGPNMWGKDLFVTYVKRPGKPSANWFGAIPISVNVKDCDKTKTSAEIGYRSGVSCMYWVLKHWNRDYLYRSFTALEWTR